MDKGRYTYKIKWILGAILLWEILFWVISFALLIFMGYRSGTLICDQLAFKFEEKLYYLYALIPLIMSFIWFLKWKNKRLEKLGSQKLLSYLVSPINSPRVFLSFFFFRNALVFTIISVAQPVFGSKKVSATMESMELVLAIDVSNSMNVKDIDPQTSRLEIVKRAMTQLINNLHGEKIGISVFAGGAYMQLPLTVDYGAAKMYIQEINTDMLSNQGTNIAAALEISQQMFSKEKVGKAILLVTDGENHEGGLDEPIAKLKESKITLAVLGVGTAQGGLIPNDPEKPEFGYKTDAKGQAIVSKLNQAMINQIAKKADGFSTICSSSYPNLLEVLEQLNQVKRSKVETVQMDVKENWYQIPLVFALVSWIVFHFIYFMPKRYNI